MDSPFSSRFSIWMMSLTPSMTRLTCSTSDDPRRSRLETSYTPPTASVNSPAEIENKSRKGHNEYWCYDNRCIDFHQVDGPPPTEDTLLRKFILSNNPGSCMRMDDWGHRWPPKC